jgi:hypothetical protein
MSQTFVPNGLYPGVSTREEYIRPSADFRAGFGQPQCGSYQTCLFTSASGKYYEGCGELSIAYNWVTGMDFVT